MKKMKTALGRNHHVSSIILIWLRVFWLSIIFIGDTLHIPVAYHAELSVFFRILCNTVCGRKFFHSS